MVLQSLCRVPKISVDGNSFFQGVLHTQLHEDAPVAFWPGSIRTVLAVFTERTAATLRQGRLEGSWVVFDMDAPWPIDDDTLTRTVRYRCPALSSGAGAGWQVTGRKAVAHAWRGFFWAAGDVPGDP